MSFFKTSYKCFLRFANVCFCVLPIKVTEATVRSITFLRLGGLFSFCASICSSAISNTADIEKLYWNTWWSLISIFLTGVMFLFLAAAPFDIVTRTHYYNLQGFSNALKFYSPHHDFLILQNSIALPLYLIDWLWLALTLLQSFFLYLNYLLHCSPSLLGNSQVRSQRGRERKTLPCLT